MTTIARRITGGVDTHLDTHVAAALDERGALLGVQSFAATGAGYKELQSLAGGLRHRRTRRYRRDRQLRGRTHPPPVRPRGLRRRSGPTEPPAPSSHRQVRPRRRSGRRPGRPRRRRHRLGQDQGRKCRGHEGVAGGPRSARSSRTQALNQMRSLISTAPEELRAELRDLSIYKVLTVPSAYRHTGRTDVAGVTKITLRTLARRAISLEEEVKEIDRMLKALVAETAPELVRHRRGGHRCGLGPLGGCRGQPRAAEERIHLRQALRRVTPRRLEREATTSPAQPRRGPSGKRGSMAHRVHPDGQRPENPALHRAPDERREDQEGSDPLPQALRGKGGVRSTPTLRVRT